MSWHTTLNDSGNQMAPRAGQLQPHERGNHQCDAGKDWYQHQTPGIVGNVRLVGNIELGGADSRHVNFFFSCWRALWGAAVWPPREFDGKKTSGRLSRN
jgi:hypothetical protein